MNLSPLPIQKFFDNAGNPLNGGLLFTYMAGTTTKIATYQDQAGTPNTNPVVLNFRGEANVWLDQTLTYKFVLAPSTDTDPPTNPIWSVDNISAGITFASLTQMIIGRLLYPQTQNEINASVTPVNYFYPPMYVDRYGTNTSPGVTSMTAAAQAAINVAKVAGGDVVFGATSQYLLDGELNCTNIVGSVSAGFRIRGIGNINPTVTAYPALLLLKHTGNAFDCTGTLGLYFENLSIATDSVTYPKVGFLLARNTDGRSQICRFLNCQVRGSFSIAIVYNYGSEDDQYTACLFWNLATDANSCTMSFTANNIRSVTSSFTTIATGAQSCIDHKIFGGEIAHEGGQTTTDTIRLDSIGNFKIIGPWMMSKNGRSIIYCDTTNGQSFGVTLIGITGENQAANSQKYGIYFGDTVRTVSLWVIRSCVFPNITNSLFAHANVTISGFDVCLFDNAGQGAGVNVAGTLQGDSRFSLITNGIAAGTYGENNVDLLNKVISRAGEANLTLRDTTATSGQRNIKLRGTSGQFVIAGADNTNTVVANAMVAAFNGTVFTAISFAASQYNFNAIPGPYANDAAAAAGGVAVGGLYRNANVVQVRVV